MAGVNLLNSPSQRIAETELDYAIENTDLRSIAECTASAHTAAVKNYEFNDVCVQQYKINSKIICLNDNKSIIKCDIAGRRRPDFSFVITSSENIPSKDFNNMLEIFEKYYPNTGKFGIFMDNLILSGGKYTKRPIAQSIIKDAKLTNGQLVYITQFEIPDTKIQFEQTNAYDINCSVGTVKVYRFGRWQCIEHNMKTKCNGDYIWDSDLQECVTDDSRKPLCGSDQTAVMVDDYWECVDPFLDKICPTGTTSRLNYNTLEWECVNTLIDTTEVSKCSSAQKSAVYGSVGSTLRIPSNHCTECEKMITDPDTCETTCVPDTSKLSDPRCYVNANLCTGSSKAFYFGFPDSEYVANVSAVASYTVPFDISHSQNRMFNCLDCGSGTINSSESFYPYIAICN